MDTLKIKDWQLLDSETLKFILQESEKLLKGQIETADMLTKRAEAVIRFTIPVILLLIAYLIQALSQGNVSDIKFWGAVIFSIALVWITVISIDVFWIYRIRPTGNEPVNLSDQWDVIKKFKFDGKTQTNAFMVSRIQSMQRMIDDNKEKVKGRTEKLQSIYDAAKWTLIVSFVTVLIYGLSLIMN